MFITPIQKINSVDELSKPIGIRPASQSGGFKNIFQDLVNNVVETDAKVTQDVYELSTGKSDDLHNLGADITQAQLSVSMLLQVRNRVMEAYSEVMRINI